jgi:molecular chaperone GrpE
MKKKRIHKVEGQENLREQLARALADYDNLKKRVEKDQAKYYEIAMARFVTRMLPALDMFEQVQMHLKDSGLAIAMDELKGKFAEEGVEAIEPRAGDKFDEKYMEAVEVREGKRDGEVLELGLKGWKTGDRILRHAKVVVGKKGEK